ncbi:MAG TPA: MFS transporter [Methylomirabilota bacterium]|nr:MFS transporter [Methylomirabilota bacterium]
MRFAALHVRDYRRYYVAVLLAMTGDSIEHVISYWVIFQKFHSPTLAGFAVLSHWVPFLLFSAYTGALADRYDCRKLIHASQSLYVLATVAWGVLILIDRLEVWHAVVILLVHGVAGVVGGTASQLIIHDMVGPANLHSAVRLNASSRHLSLLLGPALGAGLMLLAGPAGGLLANALTYLPLTVLLLRIPYTGHAERPGSSARHSGLAEWVDLMREAGADRRIMTMIVLGGATSFFVGNAFQAQMPEYAHDLGADEAGIGYSALLAANAVGAVLGAVLLESLDVLRPSARAAIACAGAWAVTLALFAATPRYGLAVALLGLAGVFNVAFSAMAQTLVQMLAPPRARGRIVGLFNTVVLGLRAGSGVIVGMLGAVTGIHASLVLGAAAVVVTAASLFAWETRSLRADRPL